MTLQVHASRRVAVVGGERLTGELLALSLRRHGLFEASWHDGEGIPDSVNADVVAVRRRPGPGRAAGRRRAGCSRRRRAHRGADRAEDEVGLLMGGADAVVPADVGGEEVAARVEVVGDGGAVVAASAPAPAARARPPARHTGSPHASDLTPRERQILLSIDRGESVKQTARSLGISPKTVENLQSRLFSKLDVRNRAQAVSHAHGLGILGEPHASSSSRGAGPRGGDHCLVAAAVRTVAVMQVAVIGLGYVGAVTAACLAEAGATVVGVDRDARKVRSLNEGRAPVIEPRLDELVLANVAEGRLRGTTDLASAPRRERRLARVRRHAVAGEREHRRAPRGARRRGHRRASSPRSTRSTPSCSARRCSRTRSSTSSCPILEASSGQQAGRRLRRGLLPGVPPRVDGRRATSSTRRSRWSGTEDGAAAVDGDRAARLPRRASAHRARSPRPRRSSTPATPSTPRRSPSPTRSPASATRRASTDAA